MKSEVPKEVAQVVAVLESAGFEAYLVGGCVRDLLLKRAPKDWDVTTSARPEKLQELFPEHVYENNFGTVGVKTESADSSVKIVEVTTFRIEGRYTDKRHPDEVAFADRVEDDLSRRDFTINALAARLDGNEVAEIIDPHGGAADLTAKIIRTVGAPEARFDEDALRLMRTVRFWTEFQGFSAGGGPASPWEIDRDTRRAIEAKAGLLEAIAKERIRDEFAKIIMAPAAGKGVILLEELDLLRYVLPELRDGLGVGQNKHHIYSVFEHNVRSLEYAAKENYSLEVRLAALLHDVGKPKAKQGEGPDCTFYNHDRIGARLAARALERLRFSKDVIEHVTHLVLYHMFYYNVGEVSPAGVRRFLARIGPENVDDFMKIREADRIGSGVPKAVPYKLRHLLFMIEKVKADPVGPKMLKVNGEDVMKVAGIPPSAKVGQILSVLLEEVLDDPARNEREALERRVKELAALSGAELIAMRKKAEGRKEEFESGQEEEMKKKYWVK